MAGTQTTLGKLYLEVADRLERIENERIAAGGAASNNNAAVIATARKIGEMTASQRAEFFSSIGLDDFAFGGAIALATALENKGDRPVDGIPGLTDQIREVLSSLEAGGSIA